MSRIRNMLDAARYGLGVAWDWITARRWRSAATGGSILAIVAAGVLLAWPWPQPLPEPAGQSQDDVVKFIASSQFAALPAEKQQPYFERMRELREQTGEGPRRGFRDLNLTEEEQDRFRENLRSAMQQRMDKEMTEYFALPKEQRTAYLDQMIDRMQQRRERPRPEGDRDRSETRNAEGTPDATPTSQPASNQGHRRRGFTPERMKQRLEHGSPERRAQRTEFMKDMRDRMEARGIEPRWGRHR